MISENTQKQIKTIWDSYVTAKKTITDKDGSVIYNIDEDRKAAIPEILGIIENFLKNKINISEFKTSLDSYNKRNNLWGFTATKGQMFFNQLTKTNENNIDQLTDLIKELIVEPKSLKDALDKIQILEKFTNDTFSKAKDKRKAPNPGSVCYFLSYFWQIHNPDKWPIFYTSLIIAFKEIDIWAEHSTRREDYEFFYNLNEEIKSILKSYSKKEISNWDAEHAFWNFKGKEVTTPKAYTPVVTEKITAFDDEKKITIKANFDIKDYLIPKVSRLTELGNESEKSSSSRGGEYERLVAEIFKQLDFEVEILGQGKGRNPDAIIKLREENTAFLVDAKAYSQGYSLGLDDRAIKEYINHHCPKLQKEGYKKIGFIIVSNSFKSNFDSFINDVTWNTDIKRFILLSSEALLYLLAYKTKDKLGLSSIIERLVSFGNIVTAENVIEEFDDF